jgi:hypothetical protein
MMRRMNRMARVFAAMVLLVCAGAAQAADVRAWLDRNSMQLGETVTLNIEVSGDSRAPQPDFSALRQDFDLLGTQSSSAVNIVNGQTSSKLLWAVGLQPHHVGTIAIPALDVAGAKTQPLTLNVQAASTTASGKSGDDLYLEASVEPKTPYVQQQVLYTVKLFFALNFSDGSMDEPHIDGVSAHKLGQDAYYTAQVGGRSYRVWEKRYALTPEKSGSLTLPSVVFRGHAIDPADINSFFTRGRAVTARSDAIALDVRARPAASGSDTWLPAHTLTLTAQGIDAMATARVGEPLTLTLDLKAQGLGFEQLPDLKLPTIDGADVYPDKTTTQNRDDGAWLYGERERKFAIVPNRAGKLTLPEIQLAWWDTANDRAELAQIPALTLTVQPAAAAPAAPAASAVSPSKIGDNVPANGTSGQPLGAGETAVFWRRLAFVTGALWLLTLLGWIVTLARARNSSPPPARPAVAAPVGLPGGVATWQRAVQAGDWPAAAKSLLAWAKSERPGLNNLGQLADALAEDEAAHAVRELDRACYGQAAAADLAVRLQSHLRKSLPWKRAASGMQDSVLPALYSARR